jgi:hypothetical protein
LSFGDPRIDAAVFGALGPGAIGFVCTIVAWLFARAAARKRETTAPSPRAGIGPALGVGLGFALASLGLDGIPERAPVGASDWVLPIMGAAIIAACAGELLTKGAKAHALRWLLRLGVVAVIVFGPLKRPWENQWEGVEAAYWLGGITLWMILAFAASDRTAAKASPFAAGLVWTAFIGGLVPVVFGAGVTAQSQIAGGVAAAIGGVTLAAWLGRKTLPHLRAVGTLVVVYTAMLLAVSWQFVSDMAWWELGVIAATPIAIALVDVIPGLRGLSAFKRQAVRIVLVVAATAAVSGHHAPELIRELTGAGGSDDPYGDYYESLGG